jgi:hypothetical protein
MQKAAVYNKCLSQMTQAHLIFKLILAFWTNLLVKVSWPLLKRGVISTQFLKLE